MNCVTGIAVRGLSILMVSFGLGACSGGGDHGGKAPAPVSGTSPLDNKVDVLALIDSSGGEPVENALLGGGDAVSTADGIIAGTVNPPDSGWVSVTADGYATGFMQRSGKALKGWYIYESHLTPIVSAAIFDGGSGVSLVAGSEASPAAEIEAGPKAFAETGVVVEMALMRPEDVGPAFAPLSDASGRHLHEALFVSAHDAPGNEIALAAGQTLRATIRDDGHLGKDFALARFSAKDGQWAVNKGGCKRSDAGHVQCDLTAAGTYGLFAAEAPAADTGSDYLNARYAYHRVLGDWLRKTGGRGASESGSPPPAVREAGQALLKAARDFAATHHDERGQMHLISTAAELQMLGMAVVSRDLIDDARKYVKGTAQDLLDQPTDCARIRTLLDTAAKADLLGMDQTRHDLIFKARNSYGACDVWAGTVRYTFFMEPQWPGDRDFHRQAGSQIWSEEHRVKILVSPMSRKTKGTDDVTLTMPRVDYRRTFSNKCADDNYERRSLYASPADATVGLIFGGLYDYVRDRFRLSAFKPTSPDDLPLIERRSRSRIARDTGSGCKHTTAETTTALVKGYSSMLTGAFTGTSAGPSVQEMLNEGERRKLGNGRVVQGGRLIRVKAPEGGLPFSRARVSWHLINVPPTP